MSALPPHHHCPPLGGPAMTGERSAVIGRRHGGAAEGGCGSAGAEAATETGLQREEIATCTVGFSYKNFEIFFATKNDVSCNSNLMLHVCVHVIETKHYNITMYIYVVLYRTKF